MRPRSIPLLLVPALLALAACDGGNPTPPTPADGGDFAAVLVSPNPEEGSALLEVLGTGIEQVRADDAFLASTPIAGGRRVVIVREVPGRVSFVVTMAEGSEPPTARVIEVADGADELRPSLAGYGVAFTRLEAR